MRPVGNPDGFRGSLPTDSVAILPQKGEGPVGDSDGFRGSLPADSVAIRPQKGEGGVAGEAERGWYRADRVPSGAGQVSSGADRWLF
jgi:hypothetical protein